MCIYICIYIYIYIYSYIKNNDNTWNSSVPQKIIGRDSFSFSRNQPSSVLILSTMQTN